MRFSIDALTRLPEDIEETIEQQHMAYEARHGVVCDYKPFALMLRSDAGQAIGALRGYTAYAEVYVDDLWIEQNCRRCGYGRALLQALDNRFQGQGYNNINLVTNDFQAAGFYKKCGFDVEFIRENKIHPKLSKIFLVKYFDCKKQSKGIALD